MSMSEADYPELDWQRAITLGVALREGLIEAVAERPVRAQEVAERLDLDPRAVQIVLTALVEQEILDEGEHGFLLREEHRGPLLDPQDPDYAGQSVVHRFELIGSWSRLPEIMKSGKPAENRTSPDFEGTDKFIATMRRAAVPGAEAVAGLVLPRLPDGARILDVGGGPGTSAEAFARGGARVTVFDRLEVVWLMKKTLAKQGIEAVAGDMFEGIPEGPFDAIYLGHTSHMYGPEENRMLFRQMRYSLAPGGLLMIRDYLRGESKDAALFAINMLVLTPGGDTFTAGQYQEWLAGAGYVGIEYVPVPGRETHLIQARNPR